MDFRAVTPAEETLITDPFFPEASPISAPIENKFRGDRIPVPAPCRAGEVPPDSSPSPLLPFYMKREYFLLGAKVFYSSYVVFSLSHDVILIVIIGYVNLG